MRQVSPCLGSNGLYTCFVATSRSVTVDEASDRMGISAFRLRKLIQSGEFPANRDGDHWAIEPYAVTSWVRAHRRSTGQLENVVLIPQSAHESLSAALDLPYYSERTIESRLGLKSGTVAQWLDGGVPESEVDRIQSLLANELSLAETSQLVVQLVGKSEDAAWSIVEAAGRRWIDVTGANGLLANIDVLRVRVVVSDEVVVRAWAG
jgi:excisionase family DNA binding protein